MGRGQKWGQSDAWRPSSQSPSSWQLWRGAWSSPKGDSKGKPKAPPVFPAYDAQRGPGYSKSSGKNGWKLGREADLEVPEAGGLTQALQTSLNGTRKAEQRVIALTAALGKREELWSQYERDIAAAYKKEHARFLRDMARIRDDLQKATVVQAESRQELVRVFYTGGAVQPFLWDRLS